MDVWTTAVLPASHFATNTFVLSAEAATNERKRTPPGTPPATPRPLVLHPVGVEVLTSTTTAPVPFWLLALTPALFATVNIPELAAVKVNVPLFPASAMPVMTTSIPGRRAGPEISVYV